MVTYSLKLEVFEGPLDLLLQLIDKQQLNIYDIPIAEVTQQYLDYLHAMEKLDLEIASEFLVMAATLLSIKSRMLLPQPPGVEENVKLEDPREEIITRLLEYKRFKQAAALLRLLQEEREDYFGHPVDREAYFRLFGDTNPLEGVKLESLAEVLRQVLAKKSTAQQIPREIERRNISIDEKMKCIAKFLRKSNRPVEFREFFEDKCSLPDVVVTFLALLEMVHRRQISIYQQESFGSIFISAAENPII